MTSPVPLHKMGQRPAPTPPPRLVQPTLPPLPTERPLSAKEAAALLGVGTRTVYRLLERGEIQKMQVDRSLRITPLALRSYIASITSGGPA